MPITKNTTVGIKEGITYLEFGTGDIAVGSGWVENKPELQMVHFSNAMPRPIEKWDDKVWHPTTDETPGLEVIMQFDNVKSIEVVIDYLNECKSRLISLERAKKEEHDYLKDVGPFI